MGKVFKYSHLFYLGLFFTLISCEEVVYINLNSSSPNIVVEGFIAMDSLCTLNLSFTTNYYDISEPLPVSDATVTLSSDRNEEEVLVDKGNGLFTGTTIIGTPGTSYTLSIERPSGTVLGYTTMPDTASIISISAGPVPFYRPGYEPPLILDIAFIDKPSQDNFYMLRIFRNDTLMNDAISLASDEFNSSGIIEYTEWRYDFKNRDRAKVEVYSIDKDLYTYFMMLNDVSSPGISFSTPYNPKSNLTGAALGYFGSWSFVSDTITVNYEKQ